jgi:apolipoprotein D and lipocalin family protein
MVASRDGWDNVQVLIALPMHKDIVLLFHAFIFRGMLQGLARRASGHKRTRFAHATAALLLCAVAVIPETGHAQSNTPVRTVPSVDLDRYVGDWFEIGRLPNRFQRRCVGDVTASYARRSDGTLDVINRCRTDGESIAARGVARVVDDTGARLKVRFAPAVLSFLPFVWGDYWILGLAGDYSWAVIGSPDRNYLWVLARTPALGEDAFGQAIAVARANGFNVDRLERTPTRKPEAAAPQRSE